MPALPNALSPASSPARRVFSQNEEDGVLERVFERLGVVKGHCVDVGAHDGLHLSNTHNLLANHGWSGLLVEGDARKHRRLAANTKHLRGVTCVASMIALEGADRLDAVLARAATPKDFDLLSIDVDGLDLHIWRSLEAHAPKVVVIEYNPSIPNAVRYVQPADPRVSHGNSAASLVDLGATKGYEPVYTTETNVVFVRRDLVDAVGVQDRRLEALRDDAPTTTYLFQGFDGTILLDGPQELFWQHVPIDLEDIQIVPKMLRRYQAGLSPPWRAVRATWIALRLVRRPRHWRELRDKVERAITKKPRPPRPF